MNYEDIAKKITNDLTKSLKVDKLTLKTAKNILEKAEKKANEMNVPVVIAVVDESGNLIAQHRMDSSLLISISLALNKAYTSIALKMATEEISKLVPYGKPLYGLENTQNEKICIMGGGIPIIKNEVFIGAIGVSGGSVEEDIIIAKAGLSIME